LRSAASSICHHTVDGQGGARACSGCIGFSRAAGGTYAMRLLGVVAAPRFRSSTYSE
jgi:hypothetical protein